MRPAVTYTSDMAAGCPGEDALMRTVSSSAMDADPAWATAGDREAVPRLESQRSLRLRPGLMSQASLGGNEAASLLRSGSFKVSCFVLSHNTQ